MAYCPRCKKEMGATEAICPHCGYDFPLEGKSRRRGLAYSSLAQIALLVGIVAAGLGSLVAAIATITALWHGDWFSGLVVGPLALFLQLAMLVVFVRVQDI
jgi:hypothetical protein